MCDVIRATYRVRGSCSNDCVFCSEHTERSVIEAGHKRGHCRIEDEEDAGEGSRESEEEGSSDVCGVPSQLPPLPEKRISRGPPKRARRPEAWTTPPLERCLMDFLNSARKKYDRENAAFDDESTG